MSAKQKGSKWKVKQCWGVGTGLPREVAHYACGFSDLNVIPHLQFNSMQSSCILKVIAAFCHMFMRFAQFDIYDSPIFHTNGSPKSVFS